MKLSEKKDATRTHEGVSIHSTNGEPVKTGTRGI